MSDQNLLRVVIAVLGALWLAWIAWSHQRKRMHGERLRGGTARGRNAGRLEPSIDGAGSDVAASARSAAAIEAMESAQTRGRSSGAPFDADLAAELEKLSQEIAGDALGEAPVATLKPGSKHASAPRGRVEPTFGDAAQEPVPPFTAAMRPDVHKAQQPQVASPRAQFGARGDAPHDRLVTLFVVAAPGEEISGYELVVATEKCGLEFGAMDIYHRLVDGRPEAGPVFSVANMTKPGSFDLTRITELSTPGLTFFMTLPGPMRALDAWDTMLPTAQRMAELLGAQVLDEEHNALGRQRIQHIRDELRGYDRTLERQTIKRSW
ncbi:MAG: cell division protein ZipA [Lysobacterales bacterium]